MTKNNGNAKVIHTNHYVYYLLENPFYIRDGPIIRTDFSIVTGFGWVGGSQLIGS